MSDQQQDEIQKVIVTRHHSLVELLILRGLVGANEDIPVLSHVTTDEVRGKHVFGVLPLHLAAAADRVTEIPIRVPESLRGKELDIEQLRKYAGEAVTYQVRVIEDID